MSSEAHKRAMKRYFKTPNGRQVQARSIKKWRLRIKTEVLTYYSNGKLACVRCGEGDITCLSIDHKNGGGHQHLKKIGGAVMLYRWLQKEGYPEGFQTLCMNCQWKKRFAEHEHRSLK